MCFCLLAYLFVDIWWPVECIVKVDIIISDISVIERKHINNLILKSLPVRLRSGHVGTRIVPHSRRKLAKNLYIFTETTSEKVLYEIND